MIKFAKNILKDLQREVDGNSPVLSTEKGDLFLLKDAPVGAIRLKMPALEYLEYIAKLPGDRRPRLSHILPQENVDYDFQIVVYAPVEMREGDTYLEGRKVTIL